VNRLRAAVLLGAVVCLSAVGQASASASPWHVVPTQSPSSQGNYFTSAAVLDANDVWTVGAWYRPIGTPATLVEHWDGTAWSTVPSPNKNNGYNELYGVSAASSSDIWAVGYYNIASYVSEKSLVEHWDGSAWSLVPSPNLGRNANILYGVAAISSNDVWAVGLGNSTNTETGFGLAMHWDGISWTIAHTPKVGSGVNQLYGVTALASNDVWAVGESSQGALILHYDGSVWSVVPNSAPSGGESELGAVAAASPTDIWAVGGMNGRTLTEHWDGTAWTVVASPNGPKPASAFSGVAFDSSGVWAVGATWNDVTVQYRPISARWNGTSWSLVQTPSPDNLSTLEGVASGPGGTWAVGARHVDTLAMHAV
jgi:uncharacterized membrane protein